VRGLANLRSRVYLVVDVRPVLGLPPVECTEDSRLIVLKPHLAENFGVLVEHGGDIVRVSAARIEETPPSATGDHPQDVVVGVCKLEHDLMNIIDAAILVEAVKTSI
jgi:purine-binding chemotaxis protein CheW